LNREKLGNKWDTVEHVPTRINVAGCALHCMPRLFSFFVVVRTSSTSSQNSSLSAFEQGKLRNKWNTVERCPNKQFQRSHFEKSAPACNLYAQSF
jgi:hypothetical protein